MQALHYYGKLYCPLDIILGAIVPNIPTHHYATVMLKAQTDGATFFKMNGRGILKNTLATNLEGMPKFLNAIKDEIEGESEYMEKLRQFSGSYGLMCEAMKVTGSIEEVKKKLGYDNLNHNKPYYFSRITTVQQSNAVCVKPAQPKISMKLLQVSPENVVEEGLVSCSENQVFLSDQPPTPQQPTLPQPIPQQPIPQEPQRIESTLCPPQSSASQPSASLPSHEEDAVANIQLIEGAHRVYNNVTRLCKEYTKNQEQLIGHKRCINELKEQLTAAQEVSKRIRHESAEEIAKCTDENKKLNEDVSTFARENVELTKEVAALKDENTKVQKVNAELLKDCGTLREDVAVWNERCTKAQEECAKLREEHIANTAQLNDDLASSITENEEIRAVLLGVLNKHENKFN